MGSWRRSSVTEHELEALVSRGELPALTAAEEWRVPGDEAEPNPLAGYIVSFISFHERGFGVPADDFIRGLLHFWGLEVQHLNPNGVIHLSTFVVLCEGWLRIEPHWELFKLFFGIKLQQCKLGDDTKVPAPIGCAMLQLKSGMAAIYPRFTLLSSHSGWHNGWFYLKNDPQHPLPEYTGCVFQTSPSDWRDGPTDGMRDRVLTAVTKIKALRDAGLMASSRSG